LLRGYFPNQNHHRIIQQLLNGTDPLPALVGKCRSGGRLDLAKPFGMAPLPSSPPLPLLNLNGDDGGANRLVPPAAQFASVQSSPAVASRIPHSN
jgi:hypothetical protein